MGFLNRRKKLFAPPTGLTTTPRGVQRSLPFAFDKDGASAALIGANDPFRKSNGVFMQKYDAFDLALDKINFKGIRLNPILIVDGSGSMSREYSSGAMWKLIERILAFALHVSPTGTVTVIVYGTDIGAPVVVNRSNYKDLPKLIKVPFSYTNMADAFAAAFELAKQSDIPSVILNATDGDPYTPRKPNELDNTTRTSNVVMDTSGHPIWVKNFALKEVPYLNDMDNLPSRVQILQDDDNNPIDLQGNLIPPSGNTPLVLYRNDAVALQNGDKIPGTNELVAGNGIRLMDNVDSQSCDPHTVTDAEFADLTVCELPSWIEVSVRVGTITDFPSNALRQDFNITT